MWLTWTLLLVAVGTEIAWGLSLKALSFYHAGRLFLALPLVLSLIILYLLAHVMRALPAGLTYAVWTALGTLGIVIVGAVLFHERLSPAQQICIGLCVAGVVGLKVLS